MQANLKVIRGAHDDYRMTKARARHECEHFAANGTRRLTVPCAGPIKPGTQYLRARQGRLDESSLRIECAISAGLVQAPKPRNPAGPSAEARARSIATRTRRAAAAKAIAGLDVIADDPSLDGSDRVALDDARAVLSRYAD